MYGGAIAHSPRLSSALEVTMDADRFDALTQALARTTRRGALGALAGAALELLNRKAKRRHPHRLPPPRLALQEAPPVLLGKVLAQAPMQVPARHDQMR